MEKIKKFLLLIVIAALGYFGYSHYTNKDVGDKPADSTWHNTGKVTLRISSGNTGGGHADFSPAIGSLLAPGQTWPNVNGGDYGYLVIDILNGPTYLTTTTVHWKGPKPDYKPIDPPVSEDGSDKPDNLLKFTKNGDGTYNVEYTKTSVSAPPTIGLINWEGGQTGKSPFATPASYWVQDYGFEDTTRWTSDGTSTVQGTQETGSDKYGYNYGSRAYPVNILNEAYAVNNDAYGVGMNGVWQIDIKIGSNGGVGSPDSSYCETFYLAERADMIWDVKNYLDDSPEGGSRAKSQYGREIDIMETKWQPTGPQVNLPNGDPTNTLSQMGWNTDLAGKHGYNKLATTWDSLYKAPGTDFATFGVAILSEGLYFYGYKGATQVYCIGPLVEKNDNYTQKNPFVPYIGTWTNQDLGKPGAYKKAIPGGFSTSYKNFIYVAEDDAKIKGKNPKDNPEAFGKTL